MSPWQRLITLILLSLLTACASPPQNPADICDIFEDRRSWYKAAVRAEDRWGVPPYVSMSIIYQESGFRARAKPSRTRLLGFIPWKRPSSAFGYAQVLDTTWDEYRRDAGRWGARRSRFKDAIDFVGWYSHNSYRRNGISRDDAYNLYLAYHEGNGGFARRTYEGKEWLLQTSRQVQARSNTFRSQYDGCRKALSRNWLQRLFF